MDPEEHLLLNELVEKQFGLSFPPEKRGFFELRLQPRLEALHLRRYIDYYLLLQYDLDGEVEHLARLLTNNETYFFRETYQFESLFTETDTLRELSSGSGPNSSPRVLCAGCSSGEEAYTLNIFFREQGQAAGGGPGSIDAFDIDKDRLAIARRGAYGPTSLRSLSKDQTSRYFETEGNDVYRLREAFREGVRFFYGNIMSPSTYSASPTYDLVFCRNVLIYFSDSTFHQAIENLAQALRPGGLLFLGHSESIIGRSSRFETVRLGRCIAYRKKDA
jgi:chemotaxis protein methyltransferase CheR